MSARNVEGNCQSASGANHAVFAQTNAALIIGRSIKHKLDVNPPWFPYVPPVERTFLIMPRRPESTAVTPAILQAAIREMKAVDKARFDNEKAYQLTMSLARTMLRNALITQEEYDRIDIMMTRKYRPLLGASAVELS